jgi:hypothetical protein
VFSHFIATGPACRMVDDADDGISGAWSVAKNKPTSGKQACSINRLISAQAYMFLGQIAEYWRQEGNRGSEHQ